MRSVGDVFMRSYLFGQGISKNFGLFYRECYFLVDISLQFCRYKKIMQVKVIKYKIPMLNKFREFWYALYTLSSVALEQLLEISLYIFNSIFTFIVGSQKLQK